MASTVRVTNHFGTDRIWSAREALRHAADLANNAETLLKDLPDLVLSTNPREAAIHEAQTYFEGARFYLELAVALDKGV